MRSKTRNHYYLWQKKPNYGTTWRTCSHINHGSKQHPHSNKERRTKQITWCTLLSSSEELRNVPQRRLDHKSLWRSIGKESLRGFLVTVKVRMRSLSNK